MEQVLILTALLALLVIVVVVRRKSATVKRAKNSSIKEAISQAHGSTATPVKSVVANQSSKISSVERSVAIDSVSRSGDAGQPSPKSPARNMIREETIPEDSALRRHYLSTRQAESEAITHPYPTDSTLRRHRDNLSASVLSQGFVATTIKKIDLTKKAVKVPEDSALRRHFLAQVQVEVESQLAPRPTDSTLRRHYDSQVKAKLDAYLNAA